MKVVINRCYGGFSLSDEAMVALAAQSGQAVDVVDLDRTDEHLVHVVEQLGAKANGPFAKLQVVEVPDGVEFEIDGFEKIAEKHRSWP